MGSCISSLIKMSPTLFSILLLVAGSWAGPAAPVATGNTSTTAGCDADYGWLPGVDGPGKCYMLVKDYNQCGGDFYYGMDWFDALACCYLQRGYLAEPLSEEEQTKINTYLTICILYSYIITKVLIYIYICYIFPPTVQMYNCFLLSQRWKR